MKRIIIGLAGLLAIGFAATPSHAAVVCRLNPYGDNFLSLRTGPGGQFPEISRLGPNTWLNIRGGQGGWLRVRTGDGESGWVSSRYVCGG